MKSDVVSIDRAGRIVLPKRVRQELAIKAGDTFKVTIDGVKITLTPDKTGSGFVRMGKALIFATVGDKTLNSERVQQIIETGRADHDSKSATRALVRKSRR